MRAVLLFLLFFTIGSVNAFAYPLTPNPNWAEGSLCDKKDPHYAEDRYEEKIPYCKRQVSSSLKKRLYNLYKIPEKCQHRYTIDHIIPLSIGGDNSEQNLWPEHKNVKATRPHLEQELFDDLKNGIIKQKVAIEIILEEKFKETRSLTPSSSCD